MFEVDKAENLVNKLFGDCIFYANRELKRLKNKELKIDFNVSLKVNQVNACAKKNTNGEYEVEVEFVAINKIFDTINNLLYNEGFYRLVAFEDKFNNEDAVKYLDYLFQATIKILLFHELGHIFHGHIDFLMDKNVNSGELCLYEYENTETEMSDLILQQAFEWQADDFSVTMLVGQLTYDDNVKAVNEILKSKEHSLFLIMVSATILFTLMGMSNEYRYSINYDYKEKKHLPARFRVNKFVETSFLAYEHFNKDKIDVDYNKVLQAMQVVEEWVNGYLNISEECGKYDIKNNSKDLDKEHFKYYDMVDSYYTKEMKAILKKYSYYPLS